MSEVKVEPGDILKWEKVVPPPAAEMVVISNDDRHNLRQAVQCLTDLEESGQTVGTTSAVLAGVTSHNICALWLRPGIPVDGSPLKTGLPERAMEVAVRLWVLLGNIEAGISDMATWAYEDIDATKRELRQQYPDVVGLVEVEAEAHRREEGA